MRQFKIHLKYWDLPLLLLLVMFGIPDINAQKRHGDGVLEAYDYHQVRGDLRNSQLKFERTKKGRVAFLGGSITYNPGWRDSVCAYLKQRFPLTEFEFINAGIPSMGSTSAAFRLERDVLSRGKIDLLFEEAAVNDAYIGKPSIAHSHAMEGIVRQVKKANPATDLVFMYFVDPPKMADYRKGKTPEVIQTHEKVARHYQISSINLAKEVTNRIDRGEFDWENDFKNLHPSPFGQGINARSIIAFLDKEYANELPDTAEIVSRPLPNKLDEFCYDKGRLLPATVARFGKGWHMVSSWKPTDGKATRANYVNVPLLVNDGIEKPLKFRFKGKAVGIVVPAGPDAGIIAYRIDKGKWTNFNLFTQHSKNLHLPRYYTLANELRDKKHLLEIKVLDQKDGRSTGHACRIRYFYVNKGQ